MEHQGGFTRLGHGQQPMFGPRAMLVCGCPTPDQIRLVRRLAGLKALKSLPVIFALDADQNTCLHDILTHGHGRGQGRTSSLDRAVVISGCTENEVHLLLNIFKDLRFGPQLMATLTPTSNDWTLKELLTELQKERRALKHP